MKLGQIFLTLFLISIGISELAAQSNNATLYGIITDENNQPLELANVSLKGYPIGTISSRDGSYLLRIPAKKPVTIVFSMLGYKNIEKKMHVDEEERIEMNMQLIKTDQELDEVRITEQKRSGSTITRIETKFLNNISDPSSGGVEALIKTLPGVSSNNELSSQYSVRGGNFDENLVYVNDIEIYRPALIRSGQQEGLSFINSDLVSSIEFSAGGFNAKYGDKMSSVLDIKYRKPTEFAGSASVGFLGTSVHIEDLSKNKRFSHITGIRYKTNRYLLGSLDEKGEYDPRFVDIQTFLTYKFNDHFDLSFLGNVAQNKYGFIPQTRKTEFGTVKESYSATIYFEGQEIDNYTTITGALSANYHPNNNLNMKFIASAYQSRESETYDILGEYYLNELEQDLGSENLGDSSLNIGVGAFLNHARNYLKSNVYSFSHKGAFNSENHLLNWGFRVQYEDIKDEMNEWVMRDSTGYSIPHSNEVPHTGNTINLFSTTFTDFDLQSVRLTAYLQDTYEIPLARGKLYATGGLRAHYWSYTDEMILSPRASISYYPDWEKNYVFHLSGGSYAQPGFFKELKDRQGNINPNIKSQRSTQVVLGSDHIFNAWDRPFKFSTELYYKHLEHLIPYQIDNVRIRYLSDQESKGYAAGLDMKINGEFVSGIQSWASLSIMQTREDVLNDFYLVDINEAGERIIPGVTEDDNAVGTKTIYPGYIPRPTDQRINLSVFFQDYFPGNPTYRMHLTAFFGSRLPTGPPNSERWMDTFRIPPYRRVDIGFSKVLISEDHRFSQSRMLNSVKDMWISLEVFNLLGVNNTISYFWVTNNQGDWFGVPNYLTKRKISLKLTVKF